MTATGKCGRDTVRPSRGWEEAWVCAAFASRPEEPPHPTHTSSIGKSPPRQPDTSTRGRLAECVLHSLYASSSEHGTLRAYLHIMQLAMMYGSTMPEMPYQTWAAHLARLGQAVENLATRAAAVNAPVPYGEEWYQLLRHKLLPQVEAPPLLVVAVVGGTNIGKSALFNQLAGEAASGVSPLAAGTRHPVCLLPPMLADANLLARLFEGFELHPWQSADDPLADAPEHRLFWRVSERMPARLLLLDTPDIDSDAQVNWQRAEIIRQAADVLIAVLTQQKYNDAAVKQFFRKAAEADKPVIVVFNQCDLAEDRRYWPQWLATFTQETRTQPEAVYVVPYDRQAASAMRLPFYDVGKDGTADPASMQSCSAGTLAADHTLSLRNRLAELEFDIMKWRACRGALAVVLDRAAGVPRYLQRLREAAREFGRALEYLSASKLAQVDWPPVPRERLVREACLWWDEQRPPWSRKVHGFYRRLGEVILWPVGKLREQLGRMPADPLAAFREQEQQAMLLAVEHMVDELERLAEVGNDTLRERLRGLLGGTTRERLLGQLQRDYRAQDPLEADFAGYVRPTLDAWKQNRPLVFEALRYLDRVAAVARPALSIALAVTGAVGAGELVSQAAGHATSHIVVESAVAVATTVGADTTITEASRPALVLLQNLQQGYAEHRSRWLASWLEREWLGGLLAELGCGAGILRCEAFLQAEDALQHLAAA